MCNINDQNFRQIVNNYGGIDMKILIIDDSIIDTESLIRNLEKYSKKYNIDMQINNCKDVKNLQDVINKYDILFIDVELQNGNGINLAIEIRKFNNDIKIIFTSKHAKYLKDGYKAHADRYFLKPIDQFEFEIEMENVIREYNYNYMGFYDKKIYCKKIYYKDILYIEFLQRKTYVHLLSGKIIETNLSLKEWNKMLDENCFSRVHKSFIVNLYNIDEFNKTSITLKNSEIIPLTRVYYNNFERKYINQLHLHI